MRMNKILRKITKRARRESGQVFVISAVALTSLVLIAGFTIDVGTWFLAHRQQQSRVDAAALAGASVLPGNTAGATTLAQQYKTKNGGDGEAATITFSSKYNANDTITIRATRTLPTYLTKLMGQQSVNISSTAIVRAEALTAASGVAPFAVINTQPELVSKAWFQSTTLDLNKVGPGGFKIINVDGTTGGTSPATLANWILNGCSCTASAQSWYWFWNSDPGAKFNSSAVANALNQRIGQILLFPVYDTVQSGGANLEYHILGFAGFHVTGYHFNGSKGATLTGDFEPVTWAGATSGGGGTYFGSASPRLIAEGT